MIKVFFEQCYLQIGKSGWLTGHYNFRCQPVDYSNHPSTLRVIFSSKNDDFSIIVVCVLVCVLMSITSFVPFTLPIRSRNQFVTSFYDLLLFFQQFSLTKLCFVNGGADRKL